MSGCSGLDVVNAVTPNSRVIAEGVPFSPSSDQRLDVYGPDESADGSQALPVVIFLYGGAWAAGTREQYKFVASGLTRQGYLVVVTDMRKYPEVRFPDFVQDAADAVMWSFRNVGSFGGDPERVFLVGHSSGAHVGALLHFDPRYLRQADQSRARPCGFIGLAGPYDFLPLVSPTLKEVFPAALRATSQPVNFVSGDEPPVLLIHGLKDQRVKPRNSAALQERIQAAGGSVEMKVYDDTGHATLVLALSSSLNFVAPVLNDISEFVDAQRCEPAT